MNWDLLIGAIAGGSISIIGNLITNRQNNRYDFKKHMRTLILENSFKEYEFRSNLVKENIPDGQIGYLYPYDMYLVSYTTIAKYLEKEILDEKDIDKMLNELKTISKTYRKNN